MEKRHINLLNQIKKSKDKFVDRKPNDKILIIDGLNTFIRNFSVNPTSNEDGIHIGGVVGFLKSIAHAVKTVNPTRCIIVFDGKGGSKRRRKIFPDYKNKRKPTTRFNRTDNFNSYQDERKSMVLQLNRLSEYLDYLPLTVLSVDNAEADDAIAYISKQIYNKDENNITILSTDKDFLQLVDNRITVWSPTKKKVYKPDTVLNEYGIPSHNFIFYRAIDGDKSDSIPGLKGWGLKSISKKLSLLHNDDKITMDELVEFAKDKTDDGKLFNVIVDSKNQLDLNYRLMQLDEVDISGSSKSIIMDSVRAPVNELIKYKFQKIFMEDKLWKSIPNLNSWLLTSFNTLNKYARMTIDE